MKTLLRAFLCAVTVATPLSANTRPTVVNADGYTITIPAGSAIRYVSYETGGLFHFKGQFLVSGKFYYGNFLGDEKKPRMLLHVLLDAASEARLPTFKYKGNNPTNGADTINLAPAEAFGDAVLPKDVRERLKKKGARNVTGHTTVWGDNLDVQMQCGVPFYGADFVSVYRPPPVWLTRADGHVFEC